MKKIIFDARAEKDRDWNFINSRIEKNDKDYINKNGHVGTDTWWDNFDKGQWKTEFIKGVVTNIFKKENEFKELHEFIEIDDGKNKYENERGELFDDGGEIQIGTEITFERLTIELSNRVTVSVLLKVELNKI